MNPNSFEKAISIGQEGVENFYKQNYLESKDKCVQACRLLQEMLNESCKLRKIQSLIRKTSSKAT